MERISLEESWDYDEPISILRAGLRMLKDRRCFDVFLFNMYVTSFGKSRLANLFGLCLPSLLALCQQREVAVYMHNFLETQDVERLGYHPSRLARGLVHLLERALIVCTTVIVPLESQRETIRKQFHRNVHSVMLPFMDGVSSYLFEPHYDTSLRRRALSDTFQILLFGSWGPQKDLAGPISAVEVLLRKGRKVHLTVAGPVNSNFPEYEEFVQSLVRRLPAESLSWLGAVSDLVVQRLFRSADLLVLPYLATGGYSGVMNLGTFFGIPMIAYDLPELRELAREIKANCDFVDPHDLASLMETIAKVMDSPPALPRALNSDGPFSLAVESVARLAELIDG